MFFYTPSLPEKSNKVLFFGVTKVPIYSKMLSVRFVSNNIFFRIAQLYHIDICLA